MVENLDARRLRIADAALAAWCLLWIAAGAWVALEVHGLQGLSDAGQQTGTAVERTGSALEALGSVPLVGDDLGGATEAVTRAGRQVRAESRAAGEGIPEAALVLGLAIALAPTVPLLVVHLAGRRARARRLEVVSRGLAAGGDEARAARARLARGAIDHLPAARLAAVSPHPLADEAAGRHDRLAAAEARRLGLRLPRTP